MKIRREFLHHVSKFHDLRFPKPSEWPEDEKYAPWQVKLCTDQGVELADLDRAYLEYLPASHVQIYARFGIIIRFVISGDLSEVNCVVRLNWDREHLGLRCPIALENAPVYSKGRGSGYWIHPDLDYWSEQQAKPNTIVLGRSISPSEVRRAMRMELAPGKHTRQEWRQVMQRDGWKCLRCGSMKRLTKDHVVPIARGGANDASNLQTLCHSCNSWKGAKHIDFRSSLMAGL